MLQAVLFGAGLVAAAVVLSSRRLVWYRQEKPLAEAKREAWNGQIEWLP